MRKPKSEFPLEVKDGSVIVRIYHRELVRPAEANRWFKIEPDANCNVMVFPKVGEKTIAVA